MVSIGVLSYNRHDVLRQTLDVLTTAVEYSNYEIIVVDNGSTDGSIAMVMRDFPTVRLHEVGSNVGVSARNHQARLAQGKYLFSYDDDSFPATPSTIGRVVGYMEQHPEVDVLNMACYRPHTDWVETISWPSFRYGGNAAEGYLGNYLAEGSVCFRLSSLRQMEGYDPALVWGFEGHDLALQFYKQGKKVVLAPWFMSLHYYSGVSRSLKTAAYWGARHPIWFFGKHWPRTMLPGLLGVFVVRKLIAAVLHPTLGASTLAGLRDGLRGIGKFLKARPKLTVRQALALKRAYLHFLRW